MPYLEARVGPPYYVLDVSGPGDARQECVVAFIEGDIVPLPPAKQDSAVAQMVAALEARPEVTSVVVRRVDSVTTEL